MVRQLGRASISTLVGLLRSWIVSSFYASLFFLMQREFYFYWANLCKNITCWNKEPSNTRRLSLVCFNFSNIFNSFKLKFRALTLNHFWGSLRTIVTNQSSEMDSKMMMSLKELSQVLARVGILISTSQEEKILTKIKNLSTSPKLIKEPKIYEPHSQDDIESFTNHLFQIDEEIED